MKRIHLACFAGGAMAGWGLTLAFSIQRADEKAGEKHPQHALMQAIVPQPPPSIATTSSLQERLEATLNARAELESLRLFRELVVVKDSNSGPTLARILKLFRGQTYLVKHASYILAEECNLNLIQELLEHGGLESQEGEILIRSLAESNDPAANAYLLRRVASSEDEAELRVMVSAIKSDVSLLRELASVLTDPATTTLARRNVSETLREAAGDPELRNALKDAARSAQDPLIVLLLANALEETGELGILKDGLTRIALDFARPEGERLSAINKLNGIPGADIVVMLRMVAAKDPSPEVRSVATVELLRRDSPVTGLLAVHVAPESQAQAAGFQRGDVLLSYNGQPYTVESKLREAAQQLPPDEQVPIVIYRGGEILQMTVHGGRIGVATQYVASH